MTHPCYTVHFNVLQHNGLGHSKDRTKTQIFDKKSLRNIYAMMKAWDIIVNYTIFLKNQIQPS